MEKFRFIESCFYKLFELATSAEENLIIDIDVTFYKLRKFAEEVTNIIIKKENIEHLLEMNQYDKLVELENLMLIDKLVIEYLHSLRIYGNKSVHGEKLSINEAKNSINIAEDISIYLYKRYIKSDYQERGFCVVYNPEIDCSIEYCDNFRITVQEEQEFQIVLDVITNIIFKLIIDRKSNKLLLINEIKQIGFNEFFYFYLEAIESIIQDSNDGAELIGILKEVAQKKFNTTDYIIVNRKIATTIYKTTHWYKS